MQGWEGKHQKRAELQQQASHFHKSWAYQGARRLEDPALLLGAKTSLCHRVPQTPLRVLQPAETQPLGSSGEGQSARKSMSRIHSMISSTWLGQAGEQGCVSKPTLLSATLSIWSLAELQNTRVTSSCTSASCYLQREAAELPIVVLIILLALLIVLGLLIPWFGFPRQC